MRSVVQRVRMASVTVDGQVVARIGMGLLVLLGIHTDDGDHEVSWMAEKIAHLRIFEDQEEKMNLSLLDIGAEMLIVSQFTLYGDCRKGRRPGYGTAAPPEIAEPIYMNFISRVKSMGITTGQGRFGAMMDVSLVNDGPVTLLLDSDKNF